MNGQREAVVDLGGWVGAGENVNYFISCYYLKFYLPVRHLDPEIIGYISRELIRSRDLRVVSN